MAGIRIATLVVAVVTLMLPPRWCCAVPGVRAECCEACHAQAESGASCCDCAAPDRKSPAPRQPCKCVCHDQRAQLAKGPDLDYAPPAVSLHTFAALLPTVASGPCHMVAQALPPHNVYSQLCRWLI